MASLDQLKRTFFDECDEALQQIEGGLTDLREGQGGEDTINAVFRAVHSVKGGAGMFGFEALVGFAHAFETVLDGMRRGSLAASAETIDVLLAASDALTDLVQMSRAGKPIAEGFAGDCRAALERLVAGDASTGGADDTPAPANFDGLDFTPVRADDFDFAPVPVEDSEEPSGEQSFAVTLQLKTEGLAQPDAAVRMLEALRELGRLDVQVELNSLPPLAELDPRQPYVGWNGTLRTAATQAQIDEVIAPLADVCEIALSPPDTPVAAMQASVATPIPEQAIAPLVETPAPTLVASAPPVLPSVPAGEPAEAAAAVRAPAAKPAATTTRIELEKIDRVVNMVGELVIAQAMLGQIVQDLPEVVSSRLSQVLEEVVHHTRELKDSVMSMRAQPVGAVFQRMPRLVRELSTKTVKKVRLEMSGETTEVDRSIIERLGDPLTHIIRNSVDHGIESPAARVAAGKSEEGTVRLAAEHRGGRIVIEIADDGAGINTERVFKKAVEKGLVRADAALSEDEISSLIMLPGFSTAETVSDISGRGVGMDVVRSNIQEIGGRISLKSQRGRGMTIQLALPLTLAVMDGMVIKVGHETYVMPLSAIVECLRPTRSDVNALVGTRGMLHLRGDLVPLAYLSDLLDIASADQDSDERVVIITDAGEGERFGLVVDELCGHQQVVIKSIEESYGSIPGVAAATILGNGRVAFILDVEKLSEISLNSAVSPGDRAMSSGEPALLSA